MDKIQRPPGIRPGLDQERRPGADRTAASPALTYAEAFLPIEPVDSVQPRRLAMLTQQYEQPAIAKAPAGVGGFPQLDPESGIQAPARPGAHQLSVGVDDRIP